MSRQNKKILKLSEIKEKAAEVMKVDPGMDIELEDGEIVHIEHPAFLDEDQRAAVAEAERRSSLIEGDEGYDPHNIPDPTLEMAKILVGGPERYEQLKAKGLHSGLIQAAIVSMSGDEISKRVNATDPTQG